MKNRGMLLEKVINKTIKKYKKDDTAIIHKKEIPIKFGSVNNKGNKIHAENAYIISKSTTDYYGIFDGVFLAFEAKSTKEKYIPKNNFKIHQQNYLEEISRHGGFSFYILYFSIYNEFYLIKHDDININHSVKINEVRSKGYELEIVYPGYLNILNVIEQIKNH